MADLSKAKYKAGDRVVAVGCDWAGLGTVIGLDQHSKGRFEVAWDDGIKGFHGPEWLAPVPPTEDEYVQADKHYRAYAKAAAKAAEARSRLPAGSTRARVTTANARWARAAEARDARDRELRDQYRAMGRVGTGEP